MKNYWHKGEPNKAMVWGCRSATAYEKGKPPMSTIDVLAAQKAMACAHFTLDDEDELVSDEEITCLNCRYRRWTQETFTCMKK
jgi:hypothetical protein